MINRILCFPLIVVYVLVMGCAGSLSEIKKPIQKSTEASVIEKFGFKTHYHFKQTQIDMNEEVKNFKMLHDDLLKPQKIIRFVIKTKILPAILELEDRGLIMCLLYFFPIRTIG